MASKVPLGDGAGRVLGRQERRVTHYSATLQKHLKATGQQTEKE